MTNQSSVAEATGVPDPSACRHYWVIQPASGPLSVGVCQVCGENRQFQNYVGSHAWDDFNLTSRSRLESVRMAVMAADGHGTTGGAEE